MKRCPQCGRDYNDDSMSYCLDDGSELLFGRASMDEPATAILHSTAAPDEAPTRPQIQLTGETAVLPPAVDDRLPKARRLDRRVLAAPFLIAVIVLGGFFGYRFIWPAGQIKSIAVMPFENKNSDADTDYLSDGLAESLIYRLSQLPDLKVSPTSSVFRYKGKETDPQIVAKELGVDSVMTGRITQRGDSLTISVNLVDTRNAKSLWGEQYERKLSELLTTQREIVNEIVGKLQLKLSGESQQKLAKRYTNDIEAYQLYLKGNFYQAKYTEEGYKKAIEFYQQAIARDANYALAYHGLAVAYDFANSWYLSPRDSEPKAKAAALKALELDETLAETHYLLGKIVFWYEWDWATAERHWKRANELDPAYPAYYPQYLAAMGRFDEAIKSQEVLQQRLPLDLNVNLDLASILAYAGRYDQSIEQTRKALEIDPNFWWAYQNLGLAYEGKKQYSEAIAALEKARLADVNPSSLGYLGYVYAAAGKTAEARKVLEELKELQKQRYVSPYNIATVYAGLNDKDQAFAWLERAYEDRSFYMTSLKIEIVLNNLRPDPRFKDLLKRMNLPE